MLQPSDYPRTFNASFRVTHEQEARPGIFVEAAFAVQLERELNATTAELERTKEQLRVAREALEECSEMTSEHSVHNAAQNALHHLAQSNPDKEEPNVSP